MRDSGVTAYFQNAHFGISALYTVQAAVRMFSSASSTFG
jgi:hypothetical protein